MDSRRRDSVRRRHGPALIALAAGLLLMVSGCGRIAAIGGTAAGIDSLRTDPDHLGLVAAYAGGECDGRATLLVTEAKTRIDVSVRIGPDPHGPEVCSSVGVFRIVSARLSSPVGSRAIWSDGHQLTPFDGARLLVPAALPAHFTQLGEGSGPSVGMGTTGQTGQTTSWTTRFGDPSARSSSGSCHSTRGQLLVSVGPADGSLLGTDWEPIGSAVVSGRKADLYREQTGAVLDGLAYAWKADGGTVAVVSRQFCGHDQLLSRAELLDVARSLKPA